MVGGNKRRVIDTIDRINSLKESNLLEVEKTSFLDPIDKLPLLLVISDHLDNGKVTYVSISGDTFIRVYEKVIDQPYFINNPYGFINAPRVFVPNSDGTWNEFKGRSFWGNNVYLPIEMPEDEVREILEILRSDKNNISGFPMAQKVAAQTIAADLVSVSPLSKPTGNLFYLDFVYDNGNKNK